jgi:hypothetical protein
MSDPIKVVDYDAWRRGYMPPSEHVLIDKLAFRGAKVIYSTPTSKKGQIWIVVEGQNEFMDTIDDILEFSEFLLGCKRRRLAAKAAAETQEVDLPKSEQST